MAIVGGSFRSLARALVPLGLVFILSACGGSAPSRPSPAARVVRADGFTVSLPRGWHVTHGQRGLSAGRGGYLVSVTRFRLLRPYSPARFGAAVAQLDRVAEQLAARSGGTVTGRQTLTVGGERARAYTYTGKTADTRIGFVLRGSSEYQLLCRGPAGSGAADPDGACRLLFDSFDAG